MARSTLLIALVFACRPSDGDTGSPKDVPTDGTGPTGDDDDTVGDDDDTVGDDDDDTDTTTPTTPTTPTAPSGCAVDRWDPADFGTVYDVGPGQPLATPSEVPWESLTADTLVRIWPAAQPYRDKFVIATEGTEADPVVVLGVCDPKTGALPILDGDGATTRPALDFWSETRGIVKIGGSSAPSGDAAWIYVEDLEIRGARAGNTFVDDGGAQQEYDDNAAAVFVEAGAHVTLRGNTLHDSGNGLFVAGASNDVVVSSNHIWGNGNPGSFYEHNSYTEANGVTFEFNRFGPLCAGCGGNNLKDRSAGTVIRYNWLEGGNRQLDLVESDYRDIRDEPSYRETFVYGNVLVEPDGDGNSQIVHYGGDNGDEAIYRRGTLYLWNNTVLSERAGNTTLVRLSDPAEALDARNNVLAADGSLAILEVDGAATLGSNVLPPGWRDSHDGGFSGSVTDEGTNVEAADPGFVDRAGRDLTLTATAPARDAAGAPAAEAAAHPLTLQYVLHQGAEARPDDGALDIGAFERP